MASAWAEADPKSKASTPNTKLYAPSPEISSSNPYTHNSKSTCNYTIVVSILFPLSLSSPIYIYIHYKIRILPPPPVTFPIPNSLAPGASAPKERFTLRKDSTSMAFASRSHAVSGLALRIWGSFMPGTKEISGLRKFRKKSHNSVYGALQMDWTLSLQP